MPISAPGNEREPVLTNSSPLPTSHSRSFTRARLRGFTLIELMVVIMIIGVSAAVVSLTLRDPAETQLEREAARLSALLDTARTEARSLGVFASWAPVKATDTAAGGTSADGAAANFRFDGLPEKSELPTRWLDSRIVAEIAQSPRIVLGPEPLIGAQTIVLRLNEHRLVLGTDGLGPFVVLNPDGSSRAAGN